MEEKDILKNEKNSFYNDDYKLKKAIEEYKYHIGTVDKLIQMIDVANTKEGINGWYEKSLKKKLCYRCGRTGHLQSNCFSIKHIQGYYI